MKFTIRVEINLPINRTVELFMNDDNLKKWQQGFKSKVLISGKPFQEEAISKIIFKSRKRSIELTETIISNNLPYEITALYEHIHMTNIMRNCFTSLNPDSTKLEAQIYYTKFNGFIPKLMSFFMQGVFKKQTQKWYDNFKLFAEKAN